MNAQDIHLHQGKIFLTVKLAHIIEFLQMLHPERLVQYHFRNIIDILCLNSQFNLIILVVVVLVFCEFFLLQKVSRRQSLGGHYDIYGPVQIMLANDVVRVSYNRTGPSITY